MNEYLSRNELTQIDRVAPRAAAALPAAQSGAATQALKPHAGAQAESDALSPTSEDDLASAAEYAKVHARVADILADLRSEGGTSVNEAAEQIQSLLPAPMILIPLPPASKEAVESAVTLGKRIAEQASYAHAAQAHLRRGAVDQLLSGEA